MILLYCSTHRSVIVSLALLDCKPDRLLSHPVQGSGCSLHLSQQFARLYPNTQSETILSVPSAPGIVLATGTIGSSLKGKTSVFLSTDAGFSWYQVRLAVGIVLRWKNVKDSDAFQM